MEGTKILVFLPLTYFMEGMAKLGGLRPKFFIYTHVCVSTYVHML